MPVHVGALPRWMAGLSGYWGQAPAWRLSHCVWTFSVVHVAFWGPASHMPQRNIHRCREQTA